MRKAQAPRVTQTTRAPSSKKLKPTMLAKPTNIVTPISRAMSTRASQPKKSFGFAPSTTNQAATRKSTRPSTMSTTPLITPRAKDPETRIKPRSEAKPPQLSSPMHFPTPNIMKKGSTPTETSFTSSAHSQPLSPRKDREDSDQKTSSNTTNSSPYKPNPLTNSHINQYNHINQINQINQTNQTNQTNQINQSNFTPSPEQYYHNYQNVNERHDESSSELSFPPRSDEHLNSNPENIQGVSLKMALLFQSELSDLCARTSQSVTQAENPRARVNCLEKLKDHRFRLLQLKSRYIPVSKLVLQLQNLYKLGGGDKKGEVQIHLVDQLQVNQNNFQKLMETSKRNYETELDEKKIEIHELKNNNSKIETKLKDMENEYSNEINVINKNLGNTINQLQSYQKEVEDSNMSLDSMSKEYEDFFKKARKGIRDFDKKLKEDNINITHEDLDENKQLLKESELNQIRSLERIEELEGLLKQELQKNTQSKPAAVQRHKKIQVSEEDTKSRQQLDKLKQLSSQSQSDKALLEKKCIQLDSKRKKLIQDKESLVLKLKSCEESQEQLLFVKNEQFITEQSNQELRKQLKELKKDIIYLNEEIQNRERKEVEDASKALAVAKASAAVALPNPPFATKLARVEVNLEMIDREKVQEYLFSILHNRNLIIDELHQKIHEDAVIIQGQAAAQSKAQHELIRFQGKYDKNLARFNKVKIQVLQKEKSGKCMKDCFIAFLILVLFVFIIFIVILYKFISSVSHN